MKLIDFIDTPQVAQLVHDSISGLRPEDAPWFWVSFSAGPGDGFSGVAIVRAHNVGHAAMVAHERGCNPGGEVMAFPVPEAFGPPPEVWDHRLISDRTEIERLTQLWHGCGIVRVDGGEVAS